MLGGPSFILLSLPNACITLQPNPFPDDTNHPSLKGLISESEASQEEASCLSRPQSGRGWVSREAKQTDSLREELRAQVPFNPHPSQVIETREKPLTFVKWLCSASGTGGGGGVYEDRMQLDRVGHAFSTRAEGSASPSSRSDWSTE